MSAKPRDRVVQRLTLSIPEAAESLGIGEDLFRAEILDALPRIDVGTRRLVDVEDLRRWVDKQKVTASDKPPRERRTPSASGLTASDASSQRARQIGQELKEKLDASTRKSSEAGGQVLELPRSASRRRSRAHG